MEIDILEYLSSLGESEILFVPNLGNGGDALIAAATFQLLDRLGLNYVSASRTWPSYTGKTVMYGGGGNLGQMQNFSARFLRRIHGSVKRLIILPHTIKDITPLLEEFGPNVDIICRELDSYSYVKRSVKRANVFLADDMALKLNVEQLMHTRPTVSQKLGVLADYLKFKLLPRQSAQAPSLRAVGQIFAAERVRKAMSAIAPRPTLNAFRTDGERTALKLPLNNVDVSEMLAMGVETKDLAYINSYHFLSFLQEYDRIRTNRLHVCIGALLLNKAVEFRGNNYFKCRAVYEYSLKSFPGISFENDGG
ncbi:MAG: polysaccharide pyruvyl transferase family protein [Hydrogenophaga sp.]|uniref:polysaccharide pyruvyl transferase family protein n=1 Tax=Hydrogenophaga sp. TaxID=1904254 RepID=UPI002AB9255F|nr:polysaccharide pyruvyl transferase family protein [Hydrogenophaga sp.]MDZ4283071.1 polysaccharide pyruvyl transferase family protein [Hydrogenophaga sp.]